MEKTVTHILNKELVKDINVNDNIPNLNSEYEITMEDERIWLRIMYNIESKPISATDIENLFNSKNYDEEILDLLTYNGGIMFQSEIIKQMRLSKSKISLILSDMKEKGKIYKVKRGKKCVVKIGVRPKLDDV